MFNKFTSKTFDNIKPGDLLYVDEQYIVVVEALKDSLWFYHFLDRGCTFHLSKRNCGPNAIGGFVLL